MGFGLDRGGDVAAIKTKQDLGNSNGDIHSRGWTVSAGTTELSIFNLGLLMRDNDCNLLIPIAINSARLLGPDGRSVIDCKKYVYVYMYHFTEDISYFRMP